jgi:L-lactate permease
MLVLILTMLVVLLVFPTIVPSRALGEKVLLIVAALVSIFLLEPVQRFIRNKKDERRDNAEKQWWSNREKADARRMEAIEARRRELAERNRNRNRNRH